MRIFLLICIVIGTIVILSVAVNITLILIGLFRCLTDKCNEISDDIDA